MTLEDLGRSVLELADRLELHRFSYAGLSLGGMVGMWLAIHAPDRVDRLALLCTSAYLPPASMWHERAAAVRGGRHLCRHLGVGGRALVHPGLRGAAPGRRRLVHHHDGRRRPRGLRHLL